jgi:hypothetical protein
LLQDGGKRARNQIGVHGSASVTRRHMEHNISFSRSFWDHYSNKYI